MRRFIAFTVIVLHVLLVWWLAHGSRTRIDRVPEQPQWVSLWLDPPPVPEEPPADPQPRKNSPPQQQAAQPPPAPTIEPLVPTVPVEPEPESVAPLITPAPPVNFARAAEQVARSMVDAEAAAARKRDNLNPPPRVLAKPCVPKKRSMEWKGDENPGLHWYGPIPILVTKHCSFTLGVFSCDLGKSEPNGHLFDDMKDPDRPRSSVPDPNKCD